MKSAYLVGLLGLCACAARGPTQKIEMPRPEAKPTMEVVEEGKPVDAAPAPVAKESKPQAPADLVHLSPTAANRFVAAGKENEMVVRLRIDTDHIVDAERPPVNVGLVVDTSGSMDGAAIEHARAASMAVLGRLSPGDVISVVTFGSEAKVLVESTVLDKDNFAAVREKIAEMAAWGTTDMAGGLQAGLTQVRSHFQARGINRIVLLGDGVPNDPMPLDSLARQANSQGITITALGLGDDFEETRMLRLAQLSGGTFHYVEEPKQVAAVLDKEVLRLQRVVAKASWIQLNPGPGVVFREALGMPSTAFGRGLRVSLGDLSEGQTRDVLVRMVVSERKEGSSVELLDASLHYQDPLTNSARKEQTFVGVKSSADPKAVDEARDREVEHEAVRMRVADLIVRAVQVARGGDLRGANKMVDEASKLAKDGAKQFADDELKSKVAELKKLKSSLPSLVPAPPQQFGWGGGRQPHAPRMAPAEAPAAARAVRKSHGDAVRMLQGDL